MRMSRLHVPTLKEVPKDAEVISHQLLVRGGYVRKLAAGVYDFLPLAARVLRKVETIVREELDATGAQEVRLPVVQPAEIWEESGRWQFYGPELLRFVDRKGGSFCLGPTHEEVMVDLVRRDVRSWRALPLNLYQIQIKFRDEIRPRAGLMRGREFLMKDAYSFDVDEAAALRSYDAMYGAYQRIFSRCGLDFRAVEADTGAIGGSRSHEFQVLAENGEDAIVSCTACDFAANVEQAEIKPIAPLAADADVAAAELIATPKERTIDEVAARLGVTTSACIKSLVFEADAETVMVLVRGDHEINEIKLKKLLGAAEVALASEEKVKAATGVAPGFVGPVDLLATTPAVRILADFAVAAMPGGVVGANVVGHHRTSVLPGRDFPTPQYADLRMAQAGDPCPRCDAPLAAFRGIEVGHVFYLGTKYSAPMGCNYLDEQGRDQPMVMGCYGIGVSRILAAAVEQNHDADGIIWPESIAPYQVTLLPLQMNKPEVVDAAEALYSRLTAAGIEVLLDDRNERAGAKFKDAELLGIPWSVALGARGVERGVVELKNRRTRETLELSIDDLVAQLSAR